MASVWTRFLVVALTCAAAVTASQKSITSRSLEDSNYDFQYALADFGVKFTKCQYVKMYDDNLAAAYSDTVLARKHFVVFKMCPSDECSKCNSVHGEYVLDIDDYLSPTVDFLEQQLANMCANCNDDECGEFCYMVENLATNGYVDAATYAQCQKLKNRNGATDDGEPDQLYIGPQCSSDSKNITIGLFSDQYCVVPFNGKSVEDVLGAKLSYHLLEKAYSRSASGCISCMEDDSNGNAKDNADGDNVNEMCEEIYTASAKCESAYGLTSGLVQNKRKDGEYDNQVENEFLVCNFINSLVWNSYTETGEINYMAVQDVIIREATTVQKVVLSLLTCSLVGLLCYAFVLHRHIDKRLLPSPTMLQGEGQIS